MGMTLMTGIVASIALFYNQIAGVLGKLFSVVICKVELHETVKDAVVYHIRSQYKPRSVGSIRRFKAYNIFVKKLGKYLKVIFEGNSEGMVFTKGFKLIYLKNLRSTDKSYYTGDMDMFFLRGTINIEKLLVEALDAWREQKQKGRNRFKIIKHFGETQFGKEDKAGGTRVDTGANWSNLGDNPIGLTIQDIYGYDEEESFTNLCYSKKILTFADFIGKWTESKEWYVKRNIPWRLGLLLHGMPGTGKSSFVKAMALKLNMPIHVFDLSTLSNDELAREWNTIVIDSPCIALFEDIDRVFDKDKNMNANINKQALTMDAILNCISGVENSDGVISIATCNNIDRIDESLGIPKEDDDETSTRPGRFDKFLFFDVLDVDCRTKLANQILDKHPELVAGVVAAGDKETGAQFSKRCSDLALKLYWEDKENAKK